ncbi:GNAT family N-acetyltransferase [Caulobacter sp. ErkDOM-E]|uniref:GNAT family N-acetyltransferase n=1 Tax=Caulobacter sp. ErkDOM-E TaxID=3402778 RepID=UPI003AF87AB0
MSIFGSKIYARRNGVCLCDWDGDAQNDYARLVSDPRVMAFISDGKPRSFEQAAGEVDAFNLELQTRGWSRWAVRREETGEFLGYSGFAQKEHGINFGQRFFPKLWRSRAPMAAAHMALEYGFLKLGFDQIHTLTNLNHTMAIRLNRNYLGVDDDYGVVCDTPFGPHLRIDVTRAMFLSGLQRNRQRIFARAVRAAGQDTTPDFSPPVTLA